MIASTIAMGEDVTISLEQLVQAVERARMPPPVTKITMPESVATPSGVDELGIEVVRSRYLPDDTIVLHNGVDRVRIVRLT